MEERVSNCAMGYQKCGPKVHRQLSGYYSKFLLMTQVLIEQVNTLVVLTLNSPLKLNAYISTPLL